MFVAISALLGLIFGSFATVAAYRIPRHETIVTGRSKCPQCGRTVTALENIPVFSYIFLRGRCRGCGARISIRYPLIELSTGVLFGAAACKFDLGVAAVVYMAFFWTLVVLTVIDLEHKLLPNRIVLPAFVVGWLGLIADSLVESDLDRLLHAALGAAIFGGFFFLIALLVPHGMGGGDVKLAFVLGTFLGYAAAGETVGGAIGVVLAGMFLSFLLGGIVGVTVMLATGGDRKMQVPFGPFLAAGTVLGIFIGEWLADSYLSLM